MSKHQFTNEQYEEVLRSQKAVTEKRCCEDFKYCNFAWKAIKIKKQPELLNGFRELAENGNIITVRQIEEAYKDSIILCGDNSGVVCRHLQAVLTVL